MQTQGLLTVKELGSYLGVSPCTIYRWIKAREIPFVRKPGIGIRFRREDIDEWLTRNSFQPNLFIESALKTDLALENYDKLFLKGGVKMSPKGKTWNYPFGSVYLRPTKSGKERWYIYYRVDGKRVRMAVKGAQSRADALKVLQVDVADAFRGKHGFKKEEKKIRFAEFSGLYIQNYAKVNKRSWKDDVSSVGTFRNHLKNPFLHEIGVLEIEKFKASRLNEGVSRARVNRNLTILKKMLNLAVDWGYLKENPARKVKLFPENDSNKERILGEDEKKALLASCPPHLRPIVFTALYTAMRRGELLNLKWSQLDLERRTIRVVRTKSGKTRIIPISNILIEELSRLKKKAGKSEYVFLEPRTKRPIKSVKTSFRNACKHAKLKGIRFHDLRHTAASNMVEAGIDLPTVSKILGHGTILMTMRYAHPTPENMRRAVEALAQNKPLPPSFVPAVSTQNEPDSPTPLIAAN